MIAARTLAALAFYGVAVAASAQDCQRANGVGWGAINWAEIDFALDIKEPFRAPLRADIGAVAKATAETYAAKKFSAPSLCINYPISVNTTGGTDAAVYDGMEGRITLYTPALGLDSDMMATVPLSDGEGLARGDLLKAIFAHEVFHAVQRSHTNISRLEERGADWIVEGTANAATVAVTRAMGAPDIAARLSAWQPAYDVPLHIPEALTVASPEAGSQRLARTFDFYGLVSDDIVNKAWADHYAQILSPYTRGHFFYNLGRDLGSPDGSAWMAKQFNASVDDGARGLRWLDTVLRSEGKGDLSLYYPQFIARHANALDVFSSDARALAPWDVQLAAGETVTADRPVLEVAATPVSVRVQMADPNKVYLLRHRLESFADGLTLVVGDTVIAPRGAHVALVDSGKADWLTRIVNVRPAAPWLTVPVMAQISLTATPLDVGTACVEEGGLVQLSVDPDARDLIEPELVSGRYRWSVRGATQTGPFELRAPTTSGKRDIFLEVNDKGRWRSSKVGDLTVRPNGCSIRAVMTVDGDSVVFTYSAEHDTTEFLSNDGTRMFVSKDRFAGWSPEQGYMEFPAELKAMMMPQGIPEPVDPDEIKVYGDTVEDRMVHLPKVLAELFSRSGAQAVADGAASAMAATDGSLTQKRAPLGRARPVPCPNGGEGCSAFKATAFGMMVADVIADDQGRARRVVLAGIQFDLNYGDFPIMPPPW